MKKETSTNTLYESFAVWLSSAWTVRRISRKGESWLVEEWVGSASAEQDTFQAGNILHNILKGDAIRNEILILMVNKRAPLLSADADIAGYSIKFDNYINALEQIGCASFISPAFGMSSNSFGEISPTYEEWQDMIDAMPFMARRLKEYVYLMFGGCAIDSKEVESNLSNLVSDDSLSGEYSNISSIARAKGANLEPYEIKLLAMGLDNQAMTQLHTHMNSISDSDVKDALQKTLLSMPWRKRAQVERDLNRIRQRLDETLFGMEEAKREVVAAIAGALISSSGTFRPPRILLHGKPGTGKTAMAKAIAEALNMPFQTLSMNGVSTAISIVGLEPVWRSPQPGKIIQSMLNSGVMNPLLLLDEIEKSGKSGEHGSPLDALLQALDPGQNRSFADLYLGMPVDISEMFFIATANDISDVPEPLLDRFIVVEVPEYTVHEKMAIVPFLLDQMAKEHELVQVPKFGAAVMCVLEQELLPFAGLRQIKNSLWRMLCEEAMHSEDVEQFKSRPEIRVLRDNTLPVKKAEKAGIGFL